jgi:hypothetical protein
VLLVSRRISSLTPEPKFRRSIYRTVKDLIERLERALPTVCRTKTSDELPRTASPVSELRSRDTREDAMTATIGNITFDCDDVLKLATFRSAVLGRPLDKGRIGQFASIGGTDAARREPAWYFNKVPEGKSEVQLPCLRTSGGPCTVKAE